MHLSKIRKANVQQLKTALKELMNNPRLTTGEHHAMKSTIQARAKQLGYGLKGLNQWVIEIINEGENQ